MLRFVLTLAAFALLAAAVPVHAQWQTDGVPVCTATSQQSESGVVGDGAGGSIIVWRDARLGAAQVASAR